MFLTSHDSSSTICTSYIFSPCFGPSSLSNHFSLLLLLMSSDAARLFIGTPSPLNHPNIHLQTLNPDRRRLSVLSPSIHAIPESSCRPSVTLDPSVTSEQIHLLLLYLSPLRLVHRVLCKFLIPPDLFLSSIPPFPTPLLIPSSSSDARSPLW